MSRGMLPHALTSTFSLFAQQQQNRLVAFVTVLCFSCPAAGYNQKNNPSSLVSRSYVHGSQHVPLLDLNSQTLVFLPAGPEPVSAVYSALARLSRGRGALTTSSAWPTPTLATLLWSAG